MIALEEVAHKYSLNIMQCWYLSLRAADVRELLAFGLAPALHCVRVGVGVITDHPVTPSPPLFTILVPLLLLMGPRCYPSAALVWCPLSCNVTSTLVSCPARSTFNICILYSITIFQDPHNREMKNSYVLLLLIFFSNWGPLVSIHCSARDEQEWVTKTWHLLLIHSANVLSQNFWSHESAMLWRCGC